MIRDLKKCTALIVAASMTAAQSISAFAASPEEIVLLDEEQEIVIENDLESSGDQEADESEEGVVIADSDAPDEIEIFEEESTNTDDIVLDADSAAAVDFEFSSEAKEFQQNVIAMADKSEFEKLVEGVDYAPNEVVAIADSEEEAQRIASAYGGYLKNYDYGVAVIGLEESSYDVAEAYYAGLDQELQLPAVGPNYITYLTDPVEDDDYAYDATNRSGFTPGDIWEFIYYFDYFDDPAINPGYAGSYGYQWHHDMIGSYAAWLVSTGSPDIVVAVIDTGVYDGHEELSGKVIVPKDFDLKHGLANNEDMVGHGTHVAGIIAAKYGNEAGGAGVAPDTTILALNASCAVEISGKTRYVFYGADQAKAIEYAAGSGQNTYRADIINMSIGGPIYDAVIKTAIDFAYNRGVTICASMGNESADNISYPACYDHVIGVASVNQAMEKSSFSTFGKKCDISAPGSDIFSSVPGSTSSYQYMSGTSMASPVVAGACALYMGVYGHKSPDDMEKVLKNNAKKISGSGMGAGVVNIANMFAKEIAVPTITLKDKNGNDLGSASSKAFTIKGTMPADAVLKFTANNVSGNSNAFIVYTTDGSTPSVSNRNLVNGTVLSPYDWKYKVLSVKDIIGNVDSTTNLTIKAIALNGMGSFSKVATLKFTVDKTSTTTTVSSVMITGQNNIVRGGNATYKATVLPAKVKNKTVTWSVDEASKALGVNITNKGKLTVPETVAAGTKIKIYATSADKEATDIFIVVVTDSKVNTVKISPLEKTYPYNKPVYNKKTKSLSSVTLYNVDIDGAGFESYEAFIDLKAEFLDKKGNSISADGAVWSSSNEKVAQVFNEEGYVYVIAYDKGTANITCAATDGSGKKATLKVNVVIPVSDISVTVSKSQSSWIALGNSASVKANLGNVYGTPTNKKVNWSYKIGLFSVDASGYLSNEMQYLPDSAAKDIVKNMKAITFSNGKVKVGKVAKYNQMFDTYAPKTGRYIFGFEAIATTADGTNYSASTIFRIHPNVPGQLWLGTKTQKYSSLEYHDSEIGNEYSWPIYTSGYPVFEVTSSNDEVVSAYASGSYLYFTFHKKGSVKIKIRALDGSNKTITVPIKYVESSAK